MSAAEGMQLLAPSAPTGVDPRIHREDAARPRLSVVIPCFNEERRLPDTLADVIAYLGRQPYTSEIVVVDDGSTDDTARVALAYRTAQVPLRVVSYAPNRGKGHAVRRGLLEARGAVRLFMDADNSTRIDSMETFWPAFAEGADVVIGSRAVDGARVEVRQAWYKVAAGRLGNLVIRTFAVPGIRDTQCGFKAFRAGVAMEIFPRMTQDGFGFDIEALALARRAGYEIRELPVRWRNHAGSKVRARDYVRVLGTVAAVRWRLARGRYVGAETLAQWA